MDISNLGETAIDDHTLKVDLEYSYEDFPSITSLPVFMPCNQAFFESTSGKYGLDAKNILGNGPFEMVNRYSWEHDKYINLTNRLLRRFYRGFSNDLENVRNSLLCVIILSNNPCQKQR